ncbi:hypothetical protein EXIGLDRAFT_774443 [Exidia glandulosa HHB12029]|uniref:Uncharacterized protein n=1 Tax=Exidia glandulosa HHB12029 TaxID=1314781 RepID=A0A165ECV0_EXIGL|nr:hypothetical protein EXIGLDRAFT_774443 [Exidia glandulosa HHB12029]
MDDLFVIVIVTIGCLVLLILFTWLMCCCTSRPRVAHDPLASTSYVSRCQSLGDLPRYSPRKFGPQVPVPVIKRDHVHARTESREELLPASPYGGHFEFHSHSQRSPAIATPLPHLPLPSRIVVTISEPSPVPTLEEASPIERRPARAPAQISFDEAYSISSTSPAPPPYQASARR